MTLDDPVSTPSVRIVLQVRSSFEETKARNMHEYITSHGNNLM